MTQSNAINCIKLNNIYKAVGLPKKSNSMRKFVFVILIFSFLVNNGVSAQTYKGNEIVTVDGNKYVLHKVEKGQTIFSLAREYDVEQKELVSENPQLIFGLQEGDVLKIPYKVSIYNDADNKRNKPIVQIDSDASNKFIFHVVTKSETVYSISKKYNVSISSIYTFNPEAEVEILENEILRIPRNDQQAAETDGLLREDQDFYYHKMQAGETILMLTRRYNATLADIMDCNDLQSDKIAIGEIIKIPKIIQPDDLSDNIANNYFLHKIETGDTFYSYTRRFDVTKNQLIEINPQLHDGLKAGMMIKVPVIKEQKLEVKNIDDQKFKQHTVSRGETLYSLSQQYSVSVTDIKNSNPELKNRGLNAGETVYIPQVQTIVSPDELLLQSDESQKTVKEKKYVPQLEFEMSDSALNEYASNFTLLDDDTFRISMFLPLYYQMNDSINKHWFTDEEIAVLDSMKKYDEKVLNDYYTIQVNNWGSPVDTVLVKPFKKAESPELYRRTKPFVNFYEGFLLAVDSMYRAGLNIKIDLYDSRLSKQVVDSILMTKDFINSNLIVGPVVPEIQESVSFFSSKNRIPMVSPFSSDSRYLSDNSYYFQVNPSKEYVMRKTASFIADEFYNKNFIVMTLGETEKIDEFDVVSLVKEKFFSAGIYNNIGDVLYAEVDFANSGHMGYWQVKRTLKADMENVIYIPATDNPYEREAMLSRAINSLYVLSDEFDITLVGLSDYTRFKSINTEYFHKLNLHYLTPNDVDYFDARTNSFIQQYRSLFFAEPDQYSYRGYDIGMFFMSSYVKMGDGFIDYVDKYLQNMIQSDFNFQKIDQISGFMNHTLYVMNYTPDFEIIRKSVISEGQIVLDKVAVDKSIE